MLQYAQQTAQRLGHDYVGTEHILLGLVLNKEGVAGQVLAQLGLTPENHRKIDGIPRHDPG